MDELEKLQIKIEIIISCSPNLHHLCDTENAWNKSQNIYENATGFLHLLIKYKYFDVNFKTFSP